MLPLPRPAPDPTALFRVMAGDVASIFRSMADHADASDVPDLIAAADAVEKALTHLRPGALTGGIVA